MLSIPLCRRVMLFLIFLLTYSFWWGTRFPRTYNVSRKEGGTGAVSFLIDCLFYSFRFSILPFLKGKNMGLGAPNFHSLNLLTEMVHPQEVFQDFFFKLDIPIISDTSTLRWTSKRNIRNGPPSVDLVGP